jgi:hypothetical protein
MVFGDSQCDISGVGLRIMHSSTKLIFGYHSLMLRGESSFFAMLFSDVPGLSGSLSRIKALVDVPLFHVLLGLNPLPPTPGMESDDPQRRLTPRARYSKPGKHAMIGIHGPVDQTSVKIERSAFRKSLILAFECETQTTQRLQMLAETLVYRPVVKASLARLSSGIHKDSCLRFFLFLLIKTSLIAGVL